METKSISYIQMNYSHRYIARIKLEAETPLFTGSGEIALTKDALIQKDHHGFPMILGTSLAGVLRHTLEENGNKKYNWNAFFGFQEGENGLGSKVKISSAYLILNNNKIAEGLEISKDEKAILSRFTNLPTRQHVRINDKGVAENNGLFNNEVVFKGCRFVFEMELKGDGSKEEQKQWQLLLCQLKNPFFRLGQGTRNGYGKMKVLSCKQKIFDLEKKDDFDKYINFDPSFNANNDCLKKYEIEDWNTTLTHYELNLKPDDFFIFSAGFGDDEVDNRPVEEITVEYKNDEIRFRENQTLIPASSIKGAISHRTAFHYNKLKNRFADNPTTNPKTGINNEAVNTLFGKEAGEKNALRGKVIFSDMFLKNANNNKIFNHVAIDRFTGEAIEGALFSEKVTGTDKEFIIDIFTENIKDEQIVKAFKLALEDICKGLLPLGGMTTKGHGIFTGKLIINGIEKYSYA